MMFALNLIQLNAVHESLNFVLEAKQRQCFFEDFEKDSYARLIEVFVEAGGNLGDLSIFRISS